MFDFDGYPTYSPPKPWKGTKPDFVPNPGLLKKRIAEADPPTEDQLKALRYARGIYQRALILGVVAWSDRALYSKAKNFKANYARSRRNLIQRLEAAGVAYLSRDGLYAEYHLVYGFPRSSMEKVQGKYHHVWRTKKPDEK